MKKQLLSLVLIVAFVFAFIPRTFAQEITDAVVDGNVNEIALDGTTNINETNDGSLTLESNDESDDNLEDESNDESDDESDDEEDDKEETTNQDGDADGDEEKSSDPEESELDQEIDQEEENKNLEEGNSNEVEDVNQNDDQDDENNDDGYEVIFTRENYKLVIPGGSSILLSQLNTKLGINISLSEVSEIGISNEEVLRIVKVADSNDYNIQSLKSFKTEETLIIRTTTGYEYVIKVVDPVGDTPEHGKELIDNNDGTYTIALTVVGDSEKQVSKVNVVIVLDTSGSMEDDTGNTVVTYTATNSTSNGLYGLVNGEYVPLERRGGYFSRTFWYNNVQYTGQRYQRNEADQDRMTAAKEAVNQLAESLLSNNGENGNPTDTVEMALVTFATNSNVRITKTTNYNTFSSTVNGLSANGGTNWEAALNSANGIDFGDDDQVYIIFVSDGNPTFRTTQNGYNDRYQNGIYGTGYEEEPNITRAYNAAVTAAQRIVNGDKKFYTIGAYGNVDRMEGLTTEAGAPARNYYSAADTAALKEALGAILQEIEMAGIGAVSINDGTTSSVTTSSGVSHLLDVDTTSFKYYKNDVEWIDAPEATLNSDGEVVWDLNEVGVLENDVEYKVTFVVWPSQVTLDLIAELKNDPSKYDTLDANIKRYLVKDGDGYTLLTNTTASLSFKDTREENPQTHTENYTNPDPVSTSATQMLTITKKWSNDVDQREKREIEIDVLRDGESWNHLTLNDNNNYEVSTNIAVGIMTVSDGVIEIKANGHDFSFGELGDEAYNWELKSEVVHPMLINGELTILIRQGTDEPTEGTYYKIGNYYYTVGELDEGVAKLIATNERRSWIDLTKTVNYDDNAAHFDDELFTFEITVKDKEDKDVWFSVKVSNASDAAFATEADGLVVTGATAETGNTGYYYVASNSLFTVKIKAGWNLRIINLLTGTTYTIKEKDIDSKFEFEDITYNPTTDIEGNAYEPTVNKNDYSVSGEIQKANVKYGYEYINKNVNTEIVVTKVWEDNDDANKNRPSDVVLKLSDGTTVIAQPTKVENEDGTWTYTYTGLPVYDGNGELIEYTLTEDQVLGYKEAVITGDAKKGFTVTNSLETINITIKKVWSDNDNQDGKRPESVTITLSDGTEVVLNESNNWTDTIENLPKYVNGEEVVYTAEEKNVPEGYTVSYSDDTFTITNTHTPETIELTVKKVWDDNNNRDGKRPASLKVTLNDADKTEVTLNEDNQWTATVEVSKYANGEEIKYTWTEESVDKYELTDTTVEGNVTTLTNTHTPETINITVKKVWDDGNNIVEARPDSVTVFLFANGDKIKTVELSEENDWTYTFQLLDLNDADGEEINYTVDEQDVDKYDKTITGNKEDGFTITNEYNGETGDTDPPITGIEDVTGYSNIVVELMSSLILLGVAVTAKKKLFN